MPDWPALVEPLARLAIAAAALLVAAVNGWRALAAYRSGRILVGRQRLSLRPADRASEPFTFWFRLVCHLAAALFGVGVGIAVWPKP